MIPLSVFALFLWVLYFCLRVRVSGSDILDSAMLGVGGVGFVALIKAGILWPYVVDWRITAIIVSPVIEELIRDFLTYYTARSSRSIRAIGFQSISVGGGFALAETVVYGLYYASCGGTISGIMVVLMRTPILLIGHPLFSLIFGISLFRKRPYVGMLVGIVFHMAWNAAVIYLPIHFLIVLSAGYFVVLFISIREMFYPEQQKINK